MFWALQTPRGSWPRVARYLRAQQDLVKSQGSNEQAVAIHAVSEARNALQLPSTLERHEVSPFWDFEILYVPSYLITLLNRRLIRSTDQSKLLEHSLLGWARLQWNHYVGSF